MGRTLSDIHRNIYSNYRSQGLTHEESINKFPSNIRTEVEEDIEKDPIESHFGVSSGWLLVIILGTIIGTLIFALLIIK